MAKKDIDWANLGFGYQVTDKRYVTNYKDGKWDDGAIIDESIYHRGWTYRYIQT